MPTNGTKSPRHPEATPSRAVVLDREQNLYVDVYANDRVGFDGKIVGRVYRPDPSERACWRAETAAGAFTHHSTRKGALKFLVETYRREGA